MKRGAQRLPRRNDESPPLLLLVKLWFHCDMWKSTVPMTGTLKVVTSVSSLGLYLPKQPNLPERALLQPEQLVRYRRLELNHCVVCADLTLAPCSAPRTPPTLDAAWQLCAEAVNCAIVEQLA